ncbi:MAG: glycoside hydrolase [Actinobacteria bacterium]|nr:glycoside hydrolase [Actinomycetota bacterium]
MEPRTGALTIGLSLVLALLPAPHALPAESSAVKAAVQVTNDVDPLRAHSSPQIAVNPTNGELVIVEANVRGDRACTTYISVDDGRSWFRGGDLMQEPYLDCTLGAEYGPYATLEFSEDGTLYVAFVGSEFLDRARDDTPRHIFVARSDDSGRTWETNMAFEAPADDEDAADNRRPVIAVDPTNSDFVYLSWMSKGAGVLAASSDGGRSFSAPTPAIDTDERVYQARLAVDDEGVVHAVYPSGAFDAEEPTVRPVRYRRSTDHGESWSEPKIIEPGSAGFFFNRKHQLAADPDTGSLYFTWYGTTEELPDHEDDNEIFVRTSTDGGDTWSDRITVNDDASSESTQHYDPGIAIAPNGRVDIAWYDFRNSPEPEKLPEEFAPPFNVGGFTDVYYSASTDQGRTWEENVRVTDRIIDRRIGVWSNNVHSHYNVGIASTDDTVYFAWQDSRAGDDVTNSEDIYFASLHRDSETAVTASSGGEARPWAMGAAGLLLGMGVAMVLATLVVRRRAAPSAT